MESIKEWVFFQKRIYISCALYQNTCISYYNTVALNYDASSSSEKEKKSASICVNKRVIQKKRLIKST